MKLVNRVLVLENELSPCDFHSIVLLLQKTLLQSPGVKSKLKCPQPGKDEAR